MNTRGIGFLIYLLPLLRLARHPHLDMMRGQTDSGSGPSASGRPISSMALNRPAVVGESDTGTAVVISVESCLPACSTTQDHSDTHTVKAYFHYGCALRCVAKEIETLSASLYLSPLNATRSGNGNKP